MLRNFTNLNDPIYIYIHIYRLNYAEFLSHFVLKVKSVEKSPTRAVLPVKDVRILIKMFLLCTLTVIVI